VLNSIKQSTSEIKSGVAIIKQDTSQIAAIKEDTSQIAAMHHELISLREQISALEAHDGKRLVLQRFLDQSTAYTESVADASDIHEPILKVAVDLTRLESFCISGR